MSGPDQAARSKPPAALVKATAPVVSRVAGRRWFPAWAQLHHKGRRSGKDYVIPVAVLVRPDSFVIGLPWGPKTNWVQNVIAAQGCTIRWKGADYQVTDPQLVGKDVALAAANAVQRIVITRADFGGFLRLRRPARAQS
jgi:deazaflavin-dependent oxidoreductase (nitroreductase family)